MRSVTVLKTSAGLMMLGSICPWASLFGLASASGLAVYFGWVTLLAGVAILALTRRPGLVTRRRRRCAIALGVVGALVCGLVILGVSDSQDGAALQAGWGVYLTLIASISAGWSARSALA